MAKPIKETPILYGDEAREFEERAKNIVPISEKERKKIKNDYDFMRKKCTNCNF